MKNLSIQMKECSSSYEEWHREFHHWNKFDRMDSIEVIEIRFPMMIHRVFFLKAKTGTTSVEKGNLLRIDLCCFDGAIEIELINR